LQQQASGSGMAGQDGSVQRAPALASGGVLSSGGIFGQHFCQLMHVALRSGLVQGWQLHVEKQRAALRSAQRGGLGLGTGWRRAGHPRSADLGLVLISSVQPAPAAC
jgi:hypothetical protein